MKNLLLPFNFLKNAFTPPIFEGNKEKTQSAKLLYQIITVIWILPILLITIGTLSRRSEVIPPAIVISLCLLILMTLTRVGLVKLANFFITAMIILVFGYADFQNAGNIQPSTLITAIVIILSGLLLGKRAPILISVLIAITHSTIVYFQMQGVIKLQSAPAVGFENIVITSIMVLIIGMLFQFVISRLQLAIDESRKNEKELQIANRELEENKASLEHRVQERTKALNASAEVSRRISTILEPNRLVFEVVEQIKTAFNYYHAHIYLKNESTGELIMAGGTGDVGKTLLARGHKISKGKGLVGRAAETNSLILVSDTTQDPNWLPNELLPDTKSEIAIPISLGSEVLGVLDVQQNTVNGLTEEDAELLQAISYQVAVALRNAQTYSQTQQIAERESLINEISRKIQNTATIEQALQVTVKELGTALSAKDSRVVLSLPENQ